jgi:NAD(P)-dependent dehydrogenase (short-subunit alcohol dehydrogenase family)
LIERFRLDPHSGISARHIEAMMAASYLVGMEAPGEPALLSRVALDFAPPATSSSATAPLTFALHVAERDTRFDLVRMEVAFEREGAAVANAAIDAYVRREPKVVDVAALRRRETPSDRLQGKVALVVGASRGLGAALSVALADQACEVGASFAKSADAAARVAAAVPGRIALLPADAGDAHSFAPAARAFAATHGGLDLLVCNACLPVSAVALHEATVGRIAEYVERSFALAAVPLAATLELLEQRKGMLVMISSSAVREPPPEWPHYVAAKGALEGLARTVAARGRVRVLIARPPRLDTDLMNTPGIPGDALAPEAVAAAIVGAVRAGFEVAPSRAPVVLEDFADFSEA